MSTQVLRSQTKTALLTIPFEESGGDVYVPTTASTGALTALVLISYTKRRIALTPPLHVDTKHIKSQDSAAGNQTDNGDSSSFVSELTTTMGSASNAELVDLHLSVSHGGGSSVYEVALSQIKEEDEEHRKNLRNVRQQRNWELSQIWDVFQEQISDVGGMVEKVNTEFEDFITETCNELNRYHAKFTKAVKGSKQSLDIFGWPTESPLMKLPKL
ncbi:uncharacterized protein PHACADRAFT_188919 [Phanerochaete carnosa HHB-10118-sp]|uniref:Uncharacterized protein n=1 Tax=Phanerochaete carnosa (strain HHB-10118-sp) TaxID=650164 RepID=K5WGP9_PHACS|nr:uncharacterized protein PHACADRAFT_188919 [Phanerochaete carnosa HHB-10118-sp]EKM49352.1 hypothetical protein PHACADRAFT_188919 [Phanerochaete carnosa HHB-10118-sp]